MPQILIIGYGNLLHSDDGISPRAAQCLDEALASDQIAGIACQQLMPELAPRIAEAERLILLDAEMGGVPGHIRRRDVTPAPVGDSTLSH